MTDQQNNGTASALFEKALDVAEKHLNAAVEEGGALGPYVAIAMIEAAVNRSVEDTSHEDVLGMLRDLADQIESDLRNGGADDED